MAKIRHIQVDHNGTRTVSERLLSLDRAETNPDVPNRIAKIPLQRSRVFAYKDGSSRSSFEPAEYDFDEILSAEDAEGYFARAIEKKTNLMFKEGYKVVSINPDTQTYIDKRLAQTQRAQGKPWAHLKKDVGRDLNRFSNAILVKSRDRKASGGFPRRVFKTNGTFTLIEPVAAYFHVPMETIEFKRNDMGHITHVQQRMEDGRKKTWSKNDIVHFYINKKAGWAVGTPTVTPVIDDIRTLRRIEENIDLLIYQNLFPLFQYKVGTPDRPAQVYPDGSTEIDVVRSEISYMPPEGVLVTPERHEIQLIGSEGRALRAENYLTHFKLRVFAGLGMSAVDFGEGATANKATAAQLSIQLIDTVKAVQNDFACQFKFLILDELLAEGKFDYDPLTSGNDASLVFKEIDIDKKIKMEEHAADIFTKHLIMEDEAREMVGFDALEVDDERRELSFTKLHVEPLEMLKQSSMATSPMASAAAANPMTSIEKSDIEAGQKNKEREIKAKPQPPKAPAAKKKKDALRFSTRAAFNDHLISNAFSSLLKDVKYHLVVGSPVSWIEGVIEAWKKDTAGRLITLSISRFRDGASSTGLSRWEHEFTEELRSVESSVNSAIRRLAFDISSHISRINPEQSNREVMAAMDISMNRIDAIYVTERKAAYSRGRIAAYKIQGVETLRFEIRSQDPCQECVELSKLTLRLDTVTIDSIPPHHPFCGCEVIPAGEPNV